MTLWSGVKDVFSAVDDFLVAVKKREIEDNLELAKAGYLPNPALQNSDVNGLIQPYILYGSNDPVCLERVKELEADLEELDKHPQIENNP